MNTRFLFLMLLLLLVVQSKKYLVEVDDDGQFGRLLKNMKLPKKNQVSDEVSDEVEDFKKEDIEETREEETLIESTGNRNYIAKMIILFIPQFT